MNMLNPLIRSVKICINEFISKTPLGVKMLLMYHKIRVAYLSRYSDEEFAKRSHLKATGVTLDLVRPTTFDERQWWLKINYRDPLMVTCSDKIAVRSYVESCGLADILLPILGVYESPDDVKWEEFPLPFYIKTNNSSGTNIRCDRLEQRDISRLRKILKLYLKKDHYGLSREWNYRAIVPKIFVEPVIDSGSDELIDYRFMCSFGKCNAIMADVGTADEQGRHRPIFHRNVYDCDWNQIKVEVGAPAIRDRVIPAPSRLKDMLKYAEKLSAPFPFCRVDLYQLGDGSVLFGEMTFFQRGGNNVISPESFETVLGTWVSIPDDHDIATINL